MRALVIAILLTLFITPEAWSRSPRVNTRRTAQGKTTAVKKRADVTAEPFDTIRFTPDRPADTFIRAAGYDKPLRSRHETIHLTNLTPADTILAVGLSIDYLDLQGRTLHSRVAEIRATIPPGQTRLGRFPSWDVQQSFYYVGGQTPRVARVTPFDIRVTPVYIVMDGN